MRRWRRGLLVVLLVVVLQPAVGGDALVAATIAPVHSLLQAVLGKEEKALLLLPPDASPHGAFLPPSKARQLWKTEALFYVHEDMENFLSAVLSVLPPKVRRVRLADNMTPTHRHETDLYATDSHEDLDADAHLDSQHTDSHTDSPAHDNDLNSEDGESTPLVVHEDNFHVWLDPHYAARMGERMARVLSELNPSQRDGYEARAQQLQMRLQKLDAEIAALLSPWREKPFAVAHDAYGYFVRRYQLRPPIVIGNAHGRASAKDIARAKRAMQDAGVTCILGDRHLSLPSMHNKRLNLVGAGFAPGEELYFMLMKQFAKTIADCLARG